MRDYKARLPVTKSKTLHLRTIVRAKNIALKYSFVNAQTYWVDFSIIIRYSFGLSNHWLEPLRIPLVH